MIFLCQSVTNMNCEKLSCEFMSDETFIRIQEFRKMILPKNNSRPPIKWTIWYDSYDMSHIIWVIWFEPYDLSHIISTHIGQKTHWKWIHYRWLENSVIEIADVASLPLISNLLYHILPSPNLKIPTLKNPDPKKPTSNLHNGFNYSDIPTGP